MKWINIEKEMPEKGEWIAEVRYTYPSFVWIGRYNIPWEDRDETDRFEFWLTVPPFPDWPNTDKN